MMSPRREKPRLGQRRNAVDASRASPSRQSRVTRDNAFDVMGA